MLQEFLEKNNITDKKIAVAVSGGADSLGLMLMAAEELKPLEYQIVALTVDHGLRKTSFDEAVYVKKIAEENGIEHCTLAWKGQKPKTGVEEAARKARYALLQDWCAAHGVRYLLTAHHLYDQAETFLMRLERGSGLDGLCAMKEVSPLGDVVLLRPMLQTDPKVFKDYLNGRQIKWIEDESNQDKNLLRVKMRQFLPILSEATGITPLKIAQTAERLQMSRAYFERKIESLIENNFKKLSPEIYGCSFSFFTAQENEICYRLAAFVIKNITKADYQAEAQKIYALLESIKTPTFKSATLGHCLIIKHRGMLWFTSENKTPSKYAKEDWENYINQNPYFKTHTVPACVKRMLLK